ncbi:hypothetical protein [Parasphingorhabdus halotolerans]|uniref:Uncharacterized protein n=1 Tax=Parasphingorhabdus halotolerans TaxID=2725558 RepID=A0A6H2DHS2_9SPHN|nr:hypothetical protein [Parasphingorhabdus halotolerans]QJB68219.1 hypothetical protein HF685_01970 [Parasphingorhabdus halotolerans]
MMFHKIALGGALVGLISATTAQATTVQKCLTVPQAEGLVTYLLPTAVEATRTKCATTLPATAALLKPNSEQLAKYKAAAQTAWPKAKAAVGVLAGDQLPRGISDDFLRPMADAMFTQMIGSEIKPKDCAIIDKIYSSLEPMPSANLATLAIAIVQESIKEDKAQKIPICKTLPK